MSQNTGTAQVSEWRELFDGLTKEYEGSEVTIEVLSEDFGDDYEAERLPLAYLEYDPKDDMFVVGVGGRDGRYPVILRHFVEHPKSIVLDTEYPDGLLVLEVIGGDDSRTLVSVYRSAATAGGERG